ncbi:hypothetical protein FC682_02020 [Peribacillus simplex]|uniref:hypothetical protein n=1 Tax=Peribacillus simplex TaxID=1478 RepID=UPI0010BE886A|nr:hypothetical protein [Peribacillus simplex]TKH07326.1 hypothetical protein FC682_02020 [Peribacillus simplex]
MNLTHIVKQDILAELKKGNTEVLKGFPPVLAMEYGLAMQNEADGFVEPSPINSIEVGKAMLNRMADSGIKERLIKEIEKEEKERAEKVAIAKQITETSI